MKQLLAFCFLVVFAACVNAQSGTTSKLTGTIYGASGSVIIGAQITATDSKGQKFTTVSDNNGVYILELPFTKTPLLNKREAKYNITVAYQGFRISKIDSYVFVPSKSGKMYLDIALEVGRLED